MLTTLANTLAPLKRGADGIFAGPASLTTGDQAIEVALRERVAAQSYNDYLGAVAKCHSIPVMDREVSGFLASMPSGAVILDLGGCWGWHWRKLARQRPDVGVVIVDFVRTNLAHAQTVLGSLVGTQVELVHADVTALPFTSADRGNSGFDGIWTVQVFQHVPGFDQACREAHRVLKPGGRFANTSLHITPVSRLVHKLLRKPFHVSGMLENTFYLARGSDAQRDFLATLFGTKVAERYTECFFHPDLRMSFSGREGSTVGRIDARMGGTSWLAKYLARQRSFIVAKTGRQN